MRTVNILDLPLTNSDFIDIIFKNTYDRINVKIGSIVLSHETRALQNAIIKHFGAKKGDVITVIFHQPAATQEPRK